MGRRSKKNNSKSKGKKASRAGVNEMERAHLESNASVEVQSKQFGLCFGGNLIIITVGMSSLSLPLSDFVNKTPAIKESLARDLERRGLEVDVGSLIVNFTPEPQIHHETARDWLYSQSKNPPLLVFRTPGTTPTPDQLVQTGPKSKYRVKTFGTKKPTVKDIQDNNQFGERSGTIQDVKAEEALRGALADNNPPIQDRHADIDGLKVGIQELDIHEGQDFQEDVFAHEIDIEDLETHEDQALRAELEKRDTDIKEDIEAVAEEQETDAQALEAHQDQDVRGEIGNRVAETQLTDEDVERLVNFRDNLVLEANLNPEPNVRREDIPAARHRRQRTDSGIEDLNASPAPVVVIKL